MTRGSGVPLGCLSPLVIAATTLAGLFVVALNCEGESLWSLGWIALVTGPAGIAVLTFGGISGSAILRAALAVVVGAITFVALGFIAVLIHLGHCPLF